MNRCPDCGRFHAGKCENRAHRGYVPTGGTFLRENQPRIVQWRKPSRPR